MAFREIKSWRLNFYVRIIKTVGASKPQQISAHLSGSRALWRKLMKYHVPAVAAEADPIRSIEREFDNLCSSCQGCYFIWIADQKFSFWEENSRMFLYWWKLPHISSNINTEAKLWLIYRVIHAHTLFYASLVSVPARNCSEIRVVEIRNVTLSPTISRWKINITQTWQAISITASSSNGEATTGVNFWHKQNPTPRWHGFICLPGHIPSLTLALCCFRSSPSIRLSFTASKLNHPQ